MSYFVQSFKTKKETSFIFLGCYLISNFTNGLFSKNLHITIIYFGFSFFNIYKSKKINTVNEVMILSSLMLVLSFKVSFLYSVMIAVLYLIYKKIKTFKKQFL